MPRPAQVLVLTRSIDLATYARVERALAARGAQALRFDTDRYPTEERVTVELGPRGAEVLLEAGGRAVRLADVDAVWVRQFDAGAAIPTDVDPRLRWASILEARALLQGTLESLEVFALDPPSAVRRAESKELQLRTARAVGLAIPRTLVTNDAERALAFARTCPDGVVAKMQEPPRIGRAADEREDRWAGATLATTPLGEAELARLADGGLRLCPMIFQERLRKRRELRVTVAGRRVLAAEIDSASVPGAEDDWRRAPELAARAFRACELPPETERRALDLLDALGLNYGAFDFVHTPDDRLVFLEVNPGGQFGWLEEHAGLPIADAVAEVLVDPRARRTA